FAGGGGVEAHLVLDVGDVGTVAFAEGAVLVDEVLGDQEQGQALGAGAGALGAGQHQVEDVLGHVLLGRGDEALDTFDVPGAVTLVGGLGAAGADVRTGVRFGQHHGGAPAVVDGLLGELLLCLVAFGVEDARESGARGVHVHGRVGAEDQFGGRPHQGAGGAKAAELLGKVQVVPA